MTQAVLYWLCFLLILVLGGVGSYRPDAQSRWWVVGYGLLLLIMLFLIGFKLFGSPIKG